MKKEISFITGYCKGILFAYSSARIEEVFLFEFSVNETHIEFSYLEGYDEFEKEVRVYCAIPWDIKKIDCLGDNLMSTLKQIEYLNDPYNLKEENEIKETNESLLNPNNFL